jgi:hypothetical protein
MLSIASYDQEYVDACRSSVDMTIAAYENLVTAAKASNASDTAPLEFAISSFEAPFYNHMILAIDSYFGHRARTKELKDGNPLNEVRMLCSSLMHNNGKLEEDRAIKWKPDASVLGYRIGDEIQLSSADFARLSSAFFAELEAKYVKGS